MVRNVLTGTILSSEEGFETRVRKRTDFGIMRVHIMCIQTSLWQAACGRIWLQIGRYGQICAKEHGKGLHASITKNLDHGKSSICK